jgi:magnesium-transporting ATPase (P-type)
MKNKADFSSEQFEEMRERFQGTPLEPRAKWILKQIVFILVCIGALIAVIVFADGIWLAIGLTVVAFFVGMVPELLIDLRYGKYRNEWEMANSASSPS